MRINIILTLVIIGTVSCNKSSELENNQKVTIENLKSITESEKSTDPYVIAGIDKNRAEMFFSEFKEAVKISDAKKISTMIYYPLSVTTKKGEFLIKQPKEYIEKHSELFSDSLKNVVMKQEFEKISVNYKGLRIGHGEIWFGGVGKDKDYEIKILTIKNTFKFTKINPK
jgi:hypothetical protein